MFSTSLQCDRNADNSSSSKHQFSLGNSSTFPWTLLASSVSTSTSFAYKCTKIAAAHRITKIAFFLLHRPNISSGFMQNRSIRPPLAVLNCRFTRFPVYSLLFVLPSPSSFLLLILDSYPYYFLTYLLQFSSFLPPRSQNCSDSSVHRENFLFQLKNNIYIYM